MFIAAAYLAVAGLLFLGGMVVQAQRSPAVWGWLRPEVRSPNIGAVNYLNRLAVTAGEWFDDRPSDPEVLALRIAQLRQGCTLLIFAKHPPLPKREREWLISKCREWGAQFDTQITNLEGEVDPAEVRANMDEIIRRIQSLLELRAASLQQGHV